MVIHRPEDFVINELPYDLDRNVKPAMNNSMQSNVVSSETTEIPTKCLVSTQTFNINCQIFFIDFEGRSDGESIQKILEQVRNKNQFYGFLEACKILKSNILCR